MRIKKAVKILAGVFGILALTGAAGCHRWSNLTPQEKAEKVTAKVAGKLDFTDAQRDKLAGITRDLATALKASHDERGGDLSLLVTQIESDRLSEDTLLQLWTKRRDKLDQLLPQFLGRFAELHATMTPEQKARIAEFIKDRADDHHWN